MTDHDQQSRLQSDSGPALAQLSVERARVIAIPAKQPAVSESGTSSSLRETSNLLWVETMVDASCDGCSAKATCGHSILGKWFSRKKQCLPVQCRTGEASLLAVGQWVEVGMPASAIVSASVIAYLFPLLGMLIGAVIFAGFASSSQSVASYDLASVAGAVLGMCLGAVLARATSIRFFEGRNMPRFIRAVAQGEAH